jgi:hypothetical protein
MQSNTICLIQQVVFGCILLVHYFVWFDTTQRAVSLKGLHEVLLFVVRKQRGNGLTARTETVQQLPLVACSSVVLPSVHIN